MDDVFLAALSRDDFREYLSFVEGWEVRAHQEALVEALQALADGELRNPSTSVGCGECTRFTGCCDDHRTNKLLGLMPRGWGKSDTVMEWLAWMIGRITQRGITALTGIVCHSENKASERASAIQERILGNERYRLVFPACVPNKKKWAAGAWFLKRQEKGVKDPTCMATGVDTQATGSRFTHAMVEDDILDLTDTSQTMKDRTWTAHKTKFMPCAVQGVTPIVMLSTRMAADDPAGRAMVDGDWFIVHIQALSEQEESNWPPEVYNGRPMGIATKELLKIRAQDRRTFLTQYQALPPHEEAEIFQPISVGPRPDESLVDAVRQYWDTATTNKETSSFNAMTEWWKVKGRWCCVKAIEKKMSPGQVMDMIANEYWRAEEQFPNKVLVKVEERHAGETFAEAVRRQSGARIFPQKTANTDLVKRATMVVEYLKHGQAYIGRNWGSGEGWVENLIQHLKEFPNGQYDDLASSVILGLEDMFPNRAMGRPVAQFVVEGYKVA